MPFAKQFEPKKTKADRSAEAKAGKTKAAEDKRKADDAASMAKRQEKADKAGVRDAKAAADLQASKAAGLTQIVGAIAQVKAARAAQGPASTINAGTNPGLALIPGGGGNPISVGVDVLMAWQAGGYPGEGTLQPSVSKAWTVHVNHGAKTILVHLGG